MFNLIITAWGVFTLHQFNESDRSISSECEKMHASRETQRVVTPNYIGGGELSTRAYDVTLLTIMSLNRMDRFLQILQNWEGNVGVRVPRKTGKKKALY